jgi:hypothetical protein
LLGPPSRAVLGFLVFKGTLLIFAPPRCLVLVTPPLMLAALGENKGRGRGQGHVFYLDILFYFDRVFKIKE